MNVNWKSIIEKLPTIVASILGIAAAFVKQETKFLTYIFVFLIFVIAAYTIVKWIIINKRTRGTRIITASFLYFRKLRKLVKKISKQMEKINNKSALNVLDDIIDDIVKDASGFEDVKKEENKKEVDNEHINKSFAIKKHAECIAINKIIKKTNKDFSKENNSEHKKEICYKASQQLCKEIMSMERSLLHFENYDTRIKLGEFVVKYSDDLDDVIKGYINLIGYSYIMKYKYKKGEEKIKEGINLLNKKIKAIDPKKLDDIYSAKMLIIRAYRHLSTTFYTFRNDNKKSLEYMNKGYKLLDEKEFKDYYFKNSQRKGFYYEMRLGYDTNKIYHNILALNSKKYNFSEKESIINEAIKLIDDDIKVMNELEQKNIMIVKHRVMKLRVLRAKLMRLYNESYGNASKESREGYNIEDDLKVAEDIIKNNIFIDEAFEMYAIEKVFYITNTIYDIASGKNNNEENINKNVHSNKAFNNKNYVNNTLKHHYNSNVLKKEKTQGKQKTEKQDIKQ